MLPILMLASIALGLAATDSAADQSGDQMVRASKNGEFLWKYYPPGALKRGEQGRVAFKLTIEPAGTISACDVTESSGFKSLDRETCEIMGFYARVDPVRNSDGRAIRAVQDGFIVWKLPPGATRVATATSSKMPKPDGLICRKDIKTGSLIATTTQCLTRAEWAQQERNARDEVGKIQGTGYCDGGGGPCLPPCPSAIPGSGVGSCLIG